MNIFDLNGSYLVSVGKILVLYYTFLRLDTTIELEGKTQKCVTSITDVLLTLPHPGVKPVDGDVHLSPLTQGPESVEDTLLIGELKVLQKAQVDVEPHQLVSEK